MNNSGPSIMQTMNLAKSEYLSKAKLYSITVALLFLSADSSSIPSNVSVPVVWQLQTNCSLAGVWLEVLSPVTPASLASVNMSAETLLYSKIIF